MKEIRRKAYSEVDAILDLLDSEYTEKVPAKIKEFIKKIKIRAMYPILIRTLHWKTKI